MKIQIKKVDGLILPKYAKEGDACLDILATTDPIIVGEQIGNGLYKNIDYIEYGTNLYMNPESDQEYYVYMHEYSGPVYPLFDFFVELRPRSSISKYNLILANSPATGDKTYTGEYKIRFKYLYQPCDFVFVNKISCDSSFPDYQEIYIRIDVDKIYKKGDKIVQMSPSIKFPVKFEMVDELEKTARSNGGFGSTGN